MSRTSGASLCLGKSVAGSSVVQRRHYAIARPGCHQNNSSARGLLEGFDLHLPRARRALHGFEYRAAHALGDGDVARQVRERQFPIVGSGEGVASWLHIEDAAIATAAAAERGNPGIYLIANDQPLPAREWLPAFARWLGAPPPPRISVEDALKAS